MPYFLLLKIECDKKNQILEAMESAGQEMLNGLTKCYATIPKNISFNYKMYENNEYEGVGIIEELTKDKKEI